MTDYIQSGMFARSGATYKRKMVEGEMAFGEVLEVRAGHFKVKDIFRVAIFLAVVLVAVAPAILILQGYQLAGVNMEGGVASIRVYLSVVGHMYVAFVPTVVVTAFLNWKGDPTGHTSFMAKLSFTVSFFCCCVSRGDIAAAIMSFTGMVSWWVNTRFLKHRWNYYSITGVFGVLGLTMFVAPWVTLFVVLASLTYRTTASLPQKRLLVDQTNVKVDNGATVPSENRVFATQVVPLSFDGVPEDLLHIATHISSIADNNGAFRRWAQLGDAALSSVVALHGYHVSAPVGLISEWKQNCLTRKTMTRLALLVPGAKERSTGINGVQSDNFAAEMVEALVGLSWYYAYDRGRSFLWEPNSLDFACERLGLPRRLIKKPAV